VVDGETIHSMINSHPNQKDDLASGKSLNKLQDKFKNITHIIIDEKSMLNLEMLSIINQRTQQAKDNFDLNFGGMSVILAGDFFQLAPINGKALYQTRGLSSN
jgi:ATP-dependent DNA helicase PIF1